MFPLGNAASSVTITNPRPTLRTMTPVATNVERISHPNVNVVQDPAGSSCDGKMNSPCGCVSINEWLVGLHLLIQPRTVSKRRRMFRVPGAMTDRQCLNRYLLLVEDWIDENLYLSSGVDRRDPST